MPCTNAERRIAGSSTATMSHALGVTVPGGDHIGGDARRAHPRDIRVPQLAQRDRLEPRRLALGTPPEKRNVHGSLEHQRFPSLFPSSYSGCHFVAAMA
jgi:hypothetical protein